MKSKKSVWMSVLIVAVVSLSVMLPSAALAEGPGPLHIVFAADRTRIHPGECALLEWRVEGGFAAELNGQQVPLVGNKQVCPQQTKIFTLGVDAGDRVEVRDLVVVVEGSGPSPQSPPSPKPAPKPGPQPGVMIDFRADRTNLKAGECAILRWDVEHAKEVYLDGKGVVGHSSKKVCPTKAHTYVLHVTHNGGPTEKKVTIHVNGGGAPNPPQPGNPQPGKPSTDLAVTDLYADKLPKGAVWVRVTNRGPATLTNAKIEIKCNNYGQPLGGQKPWQHVEAPWLKTVSLKPGQTATFKTKMTVDTNKYSYNVTCAVSPPSKGATFSEANWSNNNYSESIASKAPAPAPSGKPRTDLAVTDLYPTKMRGGKLMARITNRGPAALKNFKVQLSCQGAGWQGGTPKEIKSGRTVTLNLSHGQTASFDTSIAINIDQFDYYEMTCRVQGALADPNPNNNAYSELIK